MWAFRAFSNPGFYFCFQLLRSVDLNKVTKRCLNALTLKLNYMWAWSLLIYFGLFGRFIICNDVCQEIGIQSAETVKLRFFCIFLGVTFLRLKYFIQFLNTFLKCLLFSFLHLMSAFFCYVFSLSFSDSGLSLRGRNGTLKTPI